MAWRAALILVVLLASGCATQRNGLEGDRGVVASSDPLAAQAGADVLRQGGNAVDAAAAVAFALTVTEPHLSGIGGGTFIHRLAPDGRSMILDGREVAPAMATPERFMRDGQPMDFFAAHTSGDAVGVPGAVLAWSTAVELWGRLQLATDLAPAVRYAADGVPVSARLAQALQDPENEAKLRLSPESAHLFFPGSVCVQDVPADAVQDGCQGGRALTQGEPLLQPDLAATLRLVAEHGPDAFYHGAIGIDVVAAVQARGGDLTTADLARYAVVEREPLTLSYHGTEVRTMPPPGGGLVVLQMLGLLGPLYEEADVQAGSTDDLHLFLEAEHLAYADRGAYLGDPAFVDVPVAGLLDADYLAARRALIDPEHANAAVKAGRPEGAPSPSTNRRATDLDATAHTSHFVVVDLEGGVVSATATIEAEFGSGILVPGRGFLLNNELTDFDFEPGGPNQVEAGKRPRSAMSPTIALRHGEPVLAVGAAGGPTIISTTAQVTLDVLEHGLEVEEAVDAGRVYSSTYPDVRWEASLPSSSIDGLRQRGHQPERKACRPSASCRRRTSSTGIGSARRGRRAAWCTSRRNEQRFDRVAASVGGPRRAARNLRVHSKLRRWTTRMLAAKNTME